MVLKHVHMGWKFQRMLKSGMPFNLKHYFHLSNTLHTSCHSTFNGLFTVCMVVQICYHFLQKHCSAAGADPDLKLDFGKALLHRFQLFSKLVSLIYSCWLPQKIENPGLGLLQVFLNLWWSQFIWFKSAL